MDDDQDLLATAEVPIAKGVGSLDLERVKSLLLNLNPQFRCEICLQDRFRLDSADASAPCLPYYDLETPSFAVGVRYCVALTCLNCGNLKLFESKVLQARLAHEG